jgi:hypothetical protein
MRKALLAASFIVCCLALAAQQALNNDSIIKMAKAGLSDDLIVTTINSQPGAYDTSADGLIALKSAGVSDKVVAAIVAKGSAPAAPPTAPPPAASGRPVGIDDIGVYYQDKTGAWQTLEPEIVNFKTGGVLKSIASNGIVKGDVNGHIPGAHAKNVLTFPVTLAVYVPEGVDIAEYQLLRLRENSNNREFRSTTGGVFHSSGGAQRDEVQYQSVKIAPRVYKIVLDQPLGKGEYGLLPPGSYTSSNMASGGKIYTVSVPE